MSLMIKLYSLTILIFSGVSSKKIFSQNQIFTFNSADTTKTVAIYSSKKSFFKDYPVDSLVSHLNSLNTNKNVTYYKNTEDQTKTGFYADYLIDLNLKMTIPGAVAPKWETEERMTKAYVRVRQPDGNYEDRLRYVNITGERFVEASTRAGEGEIRIKIIEKSKNEKIIRKSLSATNNKEQGLKLVLIIDLIEYLLEHFSK